jgi:predicted PurR-regulated permease PerM
MHGSFIQKYFFSALLVIAFIIGFILFWPFLKVIVLAVVFSVLLHPLYKRFHRLVRLPSMASLLTILSFIIILCVPMYFIGAIVLKQTHSMYAWLVSHGSIESLTNATTLRLQHLFPSMSFNVQNSINTTIGNFSAKLGTIFTTTISTIVSFILMMLSMFYFLKDGPTWKEALIELSPLSFESNNTVIAILKKAVTGIFKGYFFVGLAQGLVTGIGFFLFHIPHPALFGLLAAFASLIPAVGSSLISIPTIIFLFVTGRTGAGFGYMLWALVFSMGIDNVLNPYIVGRQIAIHPLLVLFSILGGISLMGPIGIIIGPLITSFIYALISVYKLEMSPEAPGPLVVEELKAVE